MPTETTPIAPADLLDRINLEIQKLPKLRNCVATEVDNRPGHPSRHILWVTRFTGDCTPIVMNQINETIVAPLSGLSHIQK